MIRRKFNNKRRFNESTSWANFAKCKGDFGRIERVLTNVLEMIQDDEFRKVVLSMSDENKDLFLRYVDKLDRTLNIAYDLEDCVRDELYVPYIDYKNNL
jgi:hypothetical protein